MLRSALRSPVAGPPLRQRVKPHQTVAISACDITRPQPRQLMIPAILDELDGVVDIGDVVILVATGTHRANTDAELRGMFGDAVVDAVTIVNHDAREQSEMAWVGRLGRDVPVWLNRRWLDADVRITTGFVEPHFFAGFSGGPKMVAPGLAGLGHGARAPRRGADRRPSGHVGGHQRQPGARRHPGDRGRDRRHLLARRGARPRPADRRRVRRRPRSDARGGRRPGAVDRDATGRPSLRRRAHDRVRLSARSEPVPGGEGDVGGVPDRAAAAGRSCARPSAGTGSPTTARTAPS